MSFSGKDTKIISNSLIADANFEQNVSSVSTFDDASATPVDLTGGSATVISVSRGTSFSSKGNLRISHSAADGQGEGAVLVTRTLDPKEQASVMDIEFVYKTSSGYVDDNLELWLYDVANSVLVQPSAYKLKGSTVSSKFKAQFQTSSNASTYRIALFCPNTTATAYDLDIDELRIGPSVYNYGMPAFDAKSFTPTGSWVTNTTYSGFYSRQGEFASGKVKISLSGAPTAAALTVNLPFTIDTSKLNADAPTQPLGFGNLYDSSAGARFGVKVLYNSSTSVALRYDHETPGSAYDDNGVNQTTPWTWASGDLIEFNFENVPVLGWSSSVQMSSEADQRVVSAIYNGQPTGTLNSSYNTTTFPTKIDDTHNAYSSGTYTVPSSGKYDISSGVYVGVASEVVYSYLNVALFINGVQKITAINRSNASLVGGNTIHTQLNLKAYPLNAGDLVTIRTMCDHTTPTFDAGADRSWFSIAKVQGPSAIGATELIAAVYSATGAKTVTTTQPLNFDTKVEDTHGIVTPSATVWKATAPAPGLYQITMSAEVSSSTQNFILRKNGSTYAYLYQNQNVTSYLNSATTLIRLVTGDYIDITVDAGSTTTGSGTSVNRINIIRVGI